MANITGTTIKKVIQELVIPELQEIKLAQLEISPVRDFISDEVSNGIRRRPTPSHMASYGAGRRLIRLRRTKGDLSHTTSLRDKSLTGLGFRELKVEIKRLDEKIDSKHNEAVGLFQRLDEKIDSLHNEMNIRFKAMDEKIEFSLEFHDRLTAIEAKVAALASR